jgi:hypothetical protein
LRGQERDSVGDGLAGFAVGVFRERPDFVELQQLQRMLGGDWHGADPAGEGGLAGSHRR